MPWTRWSAASIRGPSCAVIVDERRVREALIARLRSNGGRPVGPVPGAAREGQLLEGPFEQRRVLREVVERVQVDGRIQKVLIELAAERLGAIRQVAVGVGEEEMRARVGEVRIQRIEGLESAPRIESELVVDLRQADVLRRQVAVEQQPAAIDGAIVVERDRMPQLVERLDLAVQIAEEEARVQPRRRVAGIETLGRRQRGQPFGEPLAAGSRPCRDSSGTATPSARAASPSAFRAGPRRTPGAEMQQAQAEVRLAERGIAAGRGIEIGARRLLRRLRPAG